MDIDPIVTAAVIAVLKEGITGGANWLRDKIGKEADAEEVEAEEEAQVIAKDALEQEAETEPLHVKEGVDWDKVGALFWLGNDLMWIKDMMFRGAHPERVLQGIDHAMIYVRDLGFGERSFPIDQLTLARVVISAYEGIGEIDDRIANNIRLHYRGVSQNVDNVKWYINALVESKQSGFKKERAI